MPRNNTEAKTVAVENLKLASWLLFNKQNLIERELLNNGHIRYIFGESPELSQLIQAWAVPEQRQPLSRYASIVSYEIRRAVKMRRSSGMPLRLRASEK